MRVAKVNSALIENTFRIIKSFVRGFRDVKTSFQISTWGDDSQPVKNADAIIADTANDETTVIIGYVTKNAKSNTGEKRIFATDENGNEVIDIYLKNDGTVEIAGNGDNMIRYKPLSDELYDFREDVQTELTKIQAALASVGGTYTPAILDLDISASKIDNVKTN